MPSRNSSGPSKGRGGSSRRPNKGSSAGGRNSGPNFKKSDRRKPDGDKGAGSFRDRPKKFDGRKGGDERNESNSSDSRPRFKKPFAPKGNTLGRSNFDKDRRKPAGDQRTDSSRERPFKKFDSGKGRGDRNEGDSSNSRPRSKNPYVPKGNTSGRSNFDRDRRKPAGDQRTDSSRERPFKKFDSGKGRSERTEGNRGGDSRSRYKRPNTSEGNTSIGRSKPDGDRKDSFRERPFKKFDNKEGKDDSRSRFKKSEGPEGGADRPKFDKQQLRKRGSSPNKARPAELKEAGESGSEKIRLNKFIANSGVCSRREADDLITMGLITVNGIAVTELGHKVNRSDEVRHEGKLLRAEKHVYILMNKPKGFLTTTADPQERNTVMHLIANHVKERVYPVGRLDRNTTGLLLLTNDGDLAEKLMHPSHNVKKVYKVDLDRPLTKADAQRIVDGVRLEEGVAQVDALAVVSDDRKTIGLEIHIGWNRVVRRIFEALEYSVVKLDRTTYAGLTKKDIGRGEWRFLKNEELVVLKHLQ